MNTNDLRQRIASYRKGAYYENDTPRAIQDGIALLADILLESLITFDDRLKEIRDNLRNMQE